MSHEKNPVPAFHGATQPRFGEVHIRNRGRLPHWHKDAALYFLTLRMADSLPAAVLARIAERNRILLAAQRAGLSLTPAQEVIKRDFSPRKIEEYADRGAGACVLRDPRVASALAEALRHGHDRYYRLFAWCVMPNHVHAVLHTFPGTQLGEIVKSWKLHAAAAANRILNRTGRIWQREYYDRLIRKEGELDRAIRYVLDNPARAGLNDWPWVWHSPDLASAPSRPSPD